MALLFICKHILKNKGYYVSWNFGFFKDISNMYTLARATQDLKLKFKYYLLPAIIIACIPGLFIAMYIATKK